MSGARIVGALIFALVFGALFAVEVVIYGWKATAAIWAAAICITGLVVLGAFLLTGDV